MMIISLDDSQKYLSGFKISDPITHFDVNANKSVKLKRLIDCTYFLQFRDPNILSASKLKLGH